MKPLTLATMGFGQGMVASPIQMIRAYAAFANGGFLVKPTLVRATDPVDPPVHRILSQRTVSQVVDALVSATEPPGTGVKARVEGYEIAGKTGTSQVVDPKTKKYSSSHFISSFIGFAVGVSPRIVIFTSIDKPRGVYYATDTAAPLFREVFTATANRFSLPLADSIQVSSALPTPVSSDVKPVTDFATAMQCNSNASECLMPDFRGLSSREVLQVLRGRTFDLRFVGFGIARKQVPEAGQPLKEGDAIHVDFASP